MTEQRGDARQRSTTRTSNQQRGRAQLPAGIPGDPVERRRVYAEYRAGFFAAERIVYIHRPNLHTSHVWEVDSTGQIVAPLAAGPLPESAESAAGRVVEGTAVRHDSQHAAADSTGEQSVPTGTRHGMSAPDQPALALLDSEHQPLVVDPTEPGSQRMVTSAIEIARLAEGEVAARIIHVLYRVASDPPHWRRPLIEVETNELLDALGYARSNDGRHQTVNRRQVRDALLGLQRVEIRAQRFDATHPNRRILYRAPLLYVRGATYDTHESVDLPLSALLERGLPTRLAIELGWYAGVRRPEGELGNQYVLLPRASSYYQDYANHAVTEDALLEFLYLRRSLLHNTEEPIAVRRDVAQRRAHITTRNATRARQILTRALTVLQERGFVAAFTPVPRRQEGTFQVTLDTRHLDRLAAEAPTFQRRSRKQHRQLAEHTAPTSESLWPAFDDDHDAQAPVADTTVPSSYYEAVRAEGVLYSACTLWDKVQTHLAAPPREPARASEAGDGRDDAGAIQLLREHATPLWRADLLADGDIALRLVLRLPSQVVDSIQVRPTNWLDAALAAVDSELAEEAWPEVMEIMLETARDA